MMDLARRLRKLALGEPFYLKDRFPEFRIGDHSYGELEVHRYDSPHSLSIGKYCSFAAHTAVFIGGEHRPDWVSTYPFNVLDSRFAHLKGHPHSKGDVTIGNDVWVGRGAVILSGVTIGNGAVIGAYSLVAKNVPSYAIVGGNPARLIRMRFSDEIIAELEAIGWWDWSEERLGRAVPYLQSDRIHDFVALVREGKL